MKHSHLLFESVRVNFNRKYRDERKIRQRRIQDINEREFACKMTENRLQYYFDVLYKHNR
jgi:hypothetical protein